MTYRPVTALLNECVFLFVSLVAGALGLAVLLIAVLAMWLCGSPERFTRKMIPDELHAELIVGTFNDSNGSAIYKIDPSATAKFLKKRKWKWNETPASLGQPDENCRFVTCVTNEEVGLKMDQWSSSKGSFYYIANAGSGDETIYIISPQRDRIAVAWTRT